MTFLCPYKHDFARRLTDLSSVNSSNFEFLVLDTFKTTPGCKPETFMWIKPETNSTGSDPSVPASLHLLTKQSWVTWGQGMMSSGIDTIIYHLLLYSELLPRYDMLMFVTSVPFHYIPSKAFSYFATLQPQSSVH